MRHADSFRRELLGTFSPKIWTINISGPPVRAIERLGDQRRRTFDHEFGHLLHYFTSYLGLLDLSYWLRCLRILTERDPPDMTPEAAITERSRRLVAVAREKQILSIDDDYYYEPHPWRYAEARLRMNEWIWKETTGGLFKTDATISDHRFWALRFCLGSLDDEASFIRIPAGIRSFLEHMATCVDFLGEYSATAGAKRQGYMEQVGLALYDPELLHYHAFEHYVYSGIRKSNIVKTFHLPFVACSQIVDLVTRVPYDVKEIWDLLRTAASTRGMSIESHMTHPHPSFVFPLLSAAALELPLSMGEWLDPGLYDDREERILDAVGLPSMSKLDLYRDQLLNRITSDLGPFDKKVRALLGAVNEYASSLSRAERVRTPTAKLKRCPVPIVFDNGEALDGDILTAAACQDLEWLRQRYYDMIQYPLVRDIVA
ncbi:MAG TPA: hypothetical protein VFF06_18745 [Polyangia bacterium]|nr:hypothetical protein [Polyangia bacterium]